MHNLSDMHSATVQHLSSIYLRTPLSCCRQSILSVFLFFSFKTAKMPFYAYVRSEQKLAQTENGQHRFEIIYKFYSFRFGKDSD